MTVNPLYCLILVTFTGGIVYLYLYDGVQHSRSQCDTKYYDFKKNTSLVERCNITVNVYVQFVDAHQQPKLQNDFILLTSSMQLRTNCLLHMIIVTDEFGIVWVENVFTYFKKVYPWFVLPERSYYRIENFASILYKVTKPMKELFSSGHGSFYSKSLFHIVPAVHRALPKDIDKLIILDLDMKFEVDIKHLSLLYDQMEEQNLMGMSLEQSPVYYHLTTRYREKDNRGTPIGKPPPNGMPGFNGGVKLFRLNAIRSNVLYNQYLDDPVRLSLLANSYHFKGHLGDQDFYTLLSFEHPEWFFRLSCSWNRQLCRWWERNGGYSDVFNYYNDCPEPHYIIHGNCKTEIPMKERKICMM